MGMGGGVVQTNVENLNTGFDMRLPKLVGIYKCRKETHTHTKKNVDIIDSLLD